MKIVEAEKLKPVAHHAHAPKETHIENKSIEKVWKNVSKITYCFVLQKSDIFGANNRSLRHHQDIPLSNIRATIAKRLTASKVKIRNVIIGENILFQQQIPHEYQGVDVRIDDILALRQKLKKSGTAVSLNDFIIKAAALALRVGFSKFLRK